MICVGLLSLFCVFIVVVVSSWFLMVLGVLVLICSVSLVGWFGLVLIRLM